MRIEITEATGVRTAEYGHMQQGEVRVVDDHLGTFYVKNGWARDVDGNVETGARGSLDRLVPSEWTPPGQERAANRGK